MTWTAPRTWVAGEVVTAGLLNTHVRDNLLDLFPVDTDGVWSSWTPTLTGFTATISRARYKQMHKTVDLDVSLTLTSVVTATMAVSLPPVTKFGSYGAFDHVLGNCLAWDTSGSFGGPGIVFLNNAAATMSFRSISGSVLMSATNPFTWASGDVLSFHATYEAA